MNTFQELNAALVKYNTSVRVARRARESRNRVRSREYAARARYWLEAARKHAETLGTRLVPLPGSPGVVTTELFLRLTGEETADN